MPISSARKRNSSMKKGSIKMEEMLENLLVLIKLRRLLIQAKPWLMSFGGVTGMGSLDWLSGSFIGYLIIVGV
jgi:hypothetical protein